MFEVTRNKGIHVRFKNGWTVSVQWGGGNYCDNYDEEILDRPPVPPSSTAEIAAWSEGGDWHKFEDGSEVCGWKTPDQVLAFMNEIASK